MNNENVHKMGILIMRSNLDSIIFKCQNFSQTN